MKKIIVLGLIGLFSLILTAETKTYYGMAMRYMMIDSREINDYLKSNNAPVIADTISSNISFTNRNYNDTMMIELAGGVNFSTGVVQNNSKNISTNVNYSFINMGYFMINDAKLKVTPILGMGFGETRVTIIDSRYSSFNSAFNNLADSHGIDFRKNETVLNIAGDIFYKDTNLPLPALSVRIGVLIPIGTSSWNINGLAISGGPQMVHAGSYIQVATLF